MKNIIYFTILHCSALCLYFNHVASCIEWNIRLVLDDYYEADVMGIDYSNLYIRRLGVCIGGQFGSVCLDNEFAESQAVSFVCSQLGFSPYG